MIEKCFPLMQNLVQNCNICHMPLVIIVYTVQNSEPDFAFKQVNIRNCLSPLQTWEMAQRLIDDYHGAMKMDFPPMQSTPWGWSAPPPGVFKVNVDGACSIDPVGSSGVGVVIRDESGMVIAALCKLLPSNFPAKWTELFAIEQGLLFAQEMDLPQIMMESDALSAILAINHGNFEGEAGHLVEGILQTKALFSCCSFSFLKRDYNMVAHKLAQFAKSNHCSHVWKGVTPPFVSHLIVSDLEPHAGGSLL